MGNIISLENAIHLLHQGKVIAYPTESIYGLGCDPDNETAVMTLLGLKHRSVDKGLILIASSYAQLLPYVNEEALSQKQRSKILSTWPGPVTWVFPKNTNTPAYLTGKFETLAVRVTNHPVVKLLCSYYGKPLISTSANKAGERPCRSQAHIVQCFGKDFPVLAGKLGHNVTPSQIRDSLTGRVIRQ